MQKETNIKLKLVQFNLDHEDEKNLHIAINESGLNFAGETKKMWADRLEHDYKPKKCGADQKV